jgi:hypothetical protein
MTPTIEVVCRGSWVLGTACGHCQRCIETAPATIAGLRSDLERAHRLNKVVISVIPPPCPPGHDFVDAFKVKMFEALQAQIYDEEGKMR